MFRLRWRRCPRRARRGFARARRALLLLALWGSSPAVAQEPILLAQRSSSPEHLFKEAFGRAPPTGPRVIPLGLEVDGRQVGWVGTLIAPGASKARVLPQAAPILEALSGVLQEALAARLAAAVDAKGYLPLGALEALGLTADYDPARLVIRLEVPARLRRSSIHRLGGRDVPPAGSEVVGSGRVSGFLNLRLAQDLLWSHGGEASPERQALKLGLESAVNVRGWVLEGRGELAEGPPVRPSRGEVRLVRDVPTWAVRFVAGDFTAPGGGFQPSRSLLGLSATRQFLLDPSRQVAPEEAVSFNLERPSKVEVLVNDKLVRTLQLQAGPQDLRGLLLDLGANELELVITDDQGVEQRVRKRVGLASGQLAPGVSEFSYSLGFPFQPGALDLTRDWSQPTVHLVHRQGLGRALTFGGSLQADPVNQSLGLEQLWGTYWGSIAATVAASRHTGVLGYAGGLRYERQRGGNGGSGYSSLGFGGEYRSETFALAGELASERPSYLLNAFYGRSFGPGIYGRLSFEARAQGADRTPGYGGALSLTKSFRSGVSLMLDTTARTLGGSQEELRGRLNLVWAWPEARRSVQALTDMSSVAGPRGQLTVQQQFDAGSTAVRATAGVVYEAASSRVSEALTYRGQRAEAEISHRMGNLGSAALGSSTVQARLGTALVFADGIFAISRPVTNSFAIVLPREALKGQWIGVNPSVQGYAGAVDGLGPAVLPDLQPYSWSTLRVRAPELPVGYSLGREAHALRPTYRNGTVVRVGEEGSVILRGVLRDASGEPVALGAGSFSRLVDGEESPIPFFTNRTGRFVVGALKPGKYQLRLDDASPPARFSIPEGSVGVFDLGQVSLGRSGPELIASVVSLRREPLGAGAPQDPALRAPAAGGVPAGVSSSVRGRLFGDRNANRRWDADEPTFAGVRVRAGAVTATTDEEGRYLLARVSGPRADLAVDSPEEMPFGMVPGARRVELDGSEVVADLLAPTSRFPIAPRAAFEVSLPEGRVRVQQVDKVRFPLVAWVAGVPLSEAEAAQLERLAGRVHEDKAMRLLVVATSQTTGALRGAVKRATRGARTLQRYLQATQYVPSKRLAFTVVEPLPGMDSPLGHVELVLVRLEGPPAR